jgi:hypothetical protein
MKRLHAALLLSALAMLPATARAQVSDPVMLTAQEDHARIMELLGMETIRPGANGNDTTAANYANYDESKANPYPNLPDPLLTNERDRVTTPEMWWTVRRPEIVEFFDREVYGRVPKDVPGVTWEVTSTVDSLYHGIPVRVKNLTGHVDNSSYPKITVEILASLTTPRNVEAPVPVIANFGFIGPSPFGRRPGRGPSGPTWQDMILERGWGFSIISPNSVQGDNGGALTTGIIGLVNKGQPRNLDDWGALRAWAWGASRLLDYFESDPDVDASRVGLQGHSRYGKATAVAMAYDERFATAFISSSGQGGAKLHRRNWGEIIENVAGTGEYHWMAGNYLKYAGPLTWRDLPVDSHELLAMCAPRPIFVSAGDRGDYWVDAKGTFMAAQAASPVYELLGKKGIWTNDFPPVEVGLLDGDVAFRQHSSGHTPGPNWPYFLEFAARYFNPAPSTE